MSFEKAKIDEKPINKERGELAHEKKNTSNISCNSPINERTGGFVAE